MVINDNKIESAAYSTENLFYLSVKMQSGLSGIVKYNLPRSYCKVPRPCKLQSYQEHYISFEVIFVFAFRETVHECF